AASSVYINNFASELCLLQVLYQCKNYQEKYLEFKICITEHVLLLNSADLNRQSEKMIVYAPQDKRGYVKILRFTMRIPNDLNGKSSFYCGR
ncbi:unnamed protein product, partial [Heterotrigona itama]